MKEKTKIKKTLFNTVWFYIILVVGLWILFALIAYLVLQCDFFRASNGNDTISQSYIDYMEAFYVAAGALFTGLAFTITFRSLISQNRELQKQNRRLSMQISMDVFTDAFGHAIDSDTFREARKYVYSTSFEEDIDTLVSLYSSFVKRLLKKSTTNHDKKIQEIKAKSDDEEIIQQRIIDEEKNYTEELFSIRKINEYQEIRNNLSIESFRKIKTQIPGTHDKEKDKTISTYASYERIKYFCDRMEYLGTIFYTYNHSTINEDGDKYLFLDYYGYDIVTSYEKLASFINYSQKVENQGNPYYHYSYLYECAKSREKEYQQTMKKELQI